MTKSTCTACCCLCFFGTCGCHRCYLDDPCCGIAYFLTLGFCGIGVLIDCCMIGKLVDAANLKYARQGGGGSTTVVVLREERSARRERGHHSEAPRQQLMGSTAQVDAYGGGGHQYYAPAPQQQQQQQLGMGAPQYYLPPMVEGMAGQVKSTQSFCIACGTGLPGGSRFCGNCGAPQQ